ncbi:MAG: AAA family ATPase [Spirochaetaceae bacterium]|nr:AAA family ATPase [Spirochaetaceae bacterium]
MRLDTITVRNFRCFRERQVARLGPLTLLVGDNSTGKTSFLALIRALWDVAVGHRVPDFKEDPYDLGSFEEIAHHRGGRGGHAETFEAEFDLGDFHFAATFGRHGTAPVPVRKALRSGDLWIEERWGQDRLSSLRVGNARGAWELGVPDQRRTSVSIDDRFATSLLAFALSGERPAAASLGGACSAGGSTSFTKADEKQLNELAASWHLVPPRYPALRPFASAPVRSKPRRTYDPRRPTADAEGDYIPMYLAEVYFQDREEWERLKVMLERFGQSAGLFDEVSIKQLGRKESEPFQVHVRKYSGKLKGPQRNLIDVGYGVSQVLPVIFEILRNRRLKTAPLLLLQQPEVHLHPSAQAALGSLFCQSASQHSQLVVETHSDHLLDRVRMDVRDRATTLHPDDVSILFFERDRLDVRIHSLRIDDQGNVLGAPSGYRQFFMDETRRSLGL